MIFYQNCEIKLTCLIQSKGSFIDADDDDTVYGDYHRRLKLYQFSPSHLPPVPEWLVPLSSSSPAFDTPPDAVSGHWLHPTVLPPSAAGLASCGCPWVRLPPLAHWESEPRKRKSTCSPRYLCGMKDRTEQEEASVEEEGHRTEGNRQTCGVNDLDDVNIRKRVFLPEQFGRQSLINHLLFALRAPTSLAAVHYLCTLHLVIPCPRQDVMGCALSVLYHSSYLETRGDNRKKGSITITRWLLDCCYHGYDVASSL